MRNTNGAFTLGGDAGAKIINDTDLHTITASLVELSTDAIITVLTVEGSATNVVAEYVSTPLNAVGGGSIAGISGKLITSIQLSAGTCNYAI